jgi:hypothetical protein
MNKAIVLAVDVKSHVSAAADMTRELSRDSGDKVIVVHVQLPAVPAPHPRTWMARTFASAHGPG